MPTPLTRPLNLKLPFSASGAKNAIPELATGSNLASYQTGFPPICSLPLSAGGIPPEGDDFNGILFNVSAHTLWVNAGGQYRFDAAVSTFIGGYPTGMVLQNNAGTASYVSLVDNNTTDFNTTPSSIGVTWGAYSSSAFAGLTITTTGGITTLNAAQLSANVLVIAGNLTSDSTIVVPAALGLYFIVNKTVGAFNVNVIATGGAGVAIKQGAADLIYCDGTNVGYRQASAVLRNAGDVSKSIATTYYADRAASRSGGCSRDTGVADAYVIATIPSSATGYADMQSVRFIPAFNNLTPTPTLNAGAGAKPLIRGDGGTVRPNDITVNSIINATYVAALDKWVINGLLVPDTEIQQWKYITATVDLQRGSYNVDTLAGSFGCNLPLLPVRGDSTTICDIRGNFDVNNFTIIAQGGKQIITKLGNVTSLTCNTKGLQFNVWYDGTNWRLF